MSYCKHKYINELPISEEERERLNKLHNKIFDEATDSKIFRSEDGKLYTYKSQDRFAKATAFVAKLRADYGAPIAKLIKATMTSSKLAINVEPLIQSKQGELPIMAPKTNTVGNVQIKSKLLYAGKDRPNTFLITFTTITGEYIGFAKISNSRIDSIELNPEYRKKGLGTEVYTLLAEELAKNGITLESASYTGVGSSLTKAAQGLWESLVRKGYATKTDKNYKFINKATPTTDKGLTIHKLEPVTDEGTSTVKGQLKTNQARMMQITGSSLYMGSIGEVTHKEMLQNAYDIVKAEVKKGKIEKGIVNVTQIDNKQEKSITYEDNGSGMTPDIIQDAFFTLAGTNKEGLAASESSGGFGIAKVAIFETAKLIELETIRDGVQSNVTVGGMELKTEGFEIKSQKTDKPNGTRIKLTFPQTYIDIKGKEQETKLPYGTPTIMRHPLLEGNVEVNFKKNDYKQAPLNSGVPEGMMLFTEAKTDWGTMFIYISQNEKAGRYPSIYHDIFSAGLYQFGYNFDDLEQNTIPLDIFIDIKPSVRAADAMYPFNLQREGFKPTVEDDVREMKNYIRQIWGIYQAQKTAKSMRKLFNIDTTGKDILSGETEHEKYQKAQAAQKVVAFNEFYAELQKKNADVGKTVTITNEGVIGESGDLLASKKNDDEKKTSSRDATFKADKVLQYEESKIEFDPTKPLIHNNTNMVIDEPTLQFFKEFSSWSLKAKEAILKESPFLSKNNLEIQGVGVSIDKDYAGVNITLMGQKFLFLNPFSYMNTGILEISNPLAAVTSLYEHIFLHELNHNFVGSEGSGFTGNFPLIYAHFQSMDSYKGLQENLKDVVLNNLENILKNAKEFNSASNIDESFQGERLKQDPTEGSDSSTKSNAGDVQEGDASQRLFSGTSDQDLRELDTSLRKTKFRPASSITEPGAETFDLNKIRSSSGKIGEQGATSEGIKSILTDLGINLSGVDTESIKAMADYLKANPDERKKVEDYVKGNPIKLTALPDGSFDLKDGNHRATILYYSGIQNVPAIITDLTNKTTTSTPYTGPFGGTSPDNLGMAPIAEKRFGLVSMISKAVQDHKADLKRERRTSGTRDLKQALIDAKAPQALIDAISDKTLLVEGILADNTQIADSLLGLGGKFDPASDTIFLGKALGALIGRDQVLIHEAVHAATLLTYLNITYNPEEYSEEQVKAVGALTEVAMKFASNTSTGAKLVYPTLYGVTQPVEFIAEFIANKEFREYVGSTSQDKKVDIINYIWDKILKLLGLSSTKINTELIEKMDKAIDTLFILNAENNASEAAREKNYWGTAAYQPGVVQDSEKGMVEKILTGEVEGPYQTMATNYARPYQNPIEEYSVEAEQKKKEGLDKNKKAEVISRMQSILDTLGIRVEKADLEKGVSAQADILHRLIQYSEGKLSEDNFTEETLHFVVDILQQKNKPLYDKLASQINKYAIYQDVLDNYSDVYLRPDGSRDIDKLKKEAIAQLLVQKLLTNEPIQEDKGFVAAAWRAISDYIKGLFGVLPANTRDDFNDLAESILKNKDFVTAEDTSLLGKDLMYSRKGGTFIQRALASSKKALGVRNPNERDFTGKAAVEIFDYIRYMAGTISKITEQEVNPITGEMEDVEYYVSTLGKKARVTSVLKQAASNAYKNIDKSDIAEGLREAKMMIGTNIHKTIEDILKRYIDEETGLRKTSPDLAPANKEVANNVYSFLEAFVIQRLNSYKPGTYFLIETKVVDEEAGIAGTVDFMAIDPDTNKIDILDWKTTDLSYYKNGVKTQRTDISPFNQEYWKNQMELYKGAVASYIARPAGEAHRFNFTRDIPILIGTERRKIDPNKPLDASNSIITVTEMEVGDVNTANIENFAALPVSSYFESTGLSKAEQRKFDDVITKLWGVYERIGKAIYTDEEKYKKRFEKDRIVQAIRELQVQKKASRFVNLFNDSFIRFDLLANKDLSFLDTIKEGSKYLTFAEQEAINLHLQEVYNAMEFLSAFKTFPTVIIGLYPEESKRTKEEQKVIDSIIKINQESANLLDKLGESATTVVDKLGTMYGIDQVSLNDLDNGHRRFATYMTSMLHRDEKTMQISSRMINAMVFLGNEKAKKYFDEETGEFPKVEKGFRAWLKRNGVSARKAYEKIFTQDIIAYTYKGSLYSKTADYDFLKDEIQISSEEYFKNIKEHEKDIKVTKKSKLNSLIPIVDYNYYDTLRKTQEEMIEFWQTGLEELKGRGMSGANLHAKLVAEYTKVVMPFLSSNFNLTAYDEAYKKAYDDKVEDFKTLKFDADPAEDRRKKAEFLHRFAQDHDIYTSPTALSKDNWLLKVDQDPSKSVISLTWQSVEYKELLKPGNEELLASYNLFSDLNTQAAKEGMLEGIYSPKRFVPSIDDGSSRILHYIKKAFHEGFTAFQEYLASEKPDSGYSNPKDLITNNPIRPRKIAYKSIEDEGYRSEEMFDIYQKWADHIIKYQVVSQYETRLKAVQLVQALKSGTLGTTAAGYLAPQATPIPGIVDKDRISTGPRNTKLESDLDQMLNYYLYSNSLDYKAGYQKIADMLYTLAQSAILKLKATSYIVNVIGAGSSASLLKGKAFSDWDLEFSMASTFGLGLTNKIWGTRAAEKMEYLEKFLSTRIISEQYKINAGRYKDTMWSKIKSMDIAYAGFRVGDHWIQDSLARAILLNTTVIDGHFVNIRDFVKNKYETERFKKSDTKAQRKETEKKIEEEITELKKTSNIYQLMTKSGTGWSIGGIDPNTISGLSEINTLSNKIHSYSKTAIGNVDEFDKSIARMEWSTKFWMQFKNWLPRVYGSRVGDFEFDYERDEFTYGRYRIFQNALGKSFMAVSAEVVHNLLPLLAYVHPVAGIVAFGVTKATQNTVKYSIDIQEAARENYKIKRDEWSKSGKDISKFASEQEFIDIYVNGVRNTLHAVQQMSNMVLIHVLIASLRGADKDWYWKFLSRIMWGADKELGGDKLPSELLNIMGDNIFPIIGIAVAIGEFGAAVVNETEGLIQSTWDPEGGTAKRKKAHVIGKYAKIDPRGFREVNNWLLLLSKQINELTGFNYARETEQKIPPLRR